MRVLTRGSVINNGLRYTTANIFAAMGKIKVKMCIRDRNRCTVGSNPE